MKKRKSMKVFSVIRYITLGGILGYLAFEAIYHGFIDRYAQIPAFHAICPFEAFGTFLTKLTNLEFFSNPFTSATIFFLFLLVLSILLNRVFCGFFCAFGALQEFIGNLGSKVLKKRLVINKKLDRILRAFKYVFLVLSVALAYLTTYEFFSNLIGTADGSYAFSQIDPWIAFKSLLSNNLLVSGYIASLVVLAISLIGSFFFQRFYCKYMCPLGAATAVFGSLSGLHIHRNVKPVLDESAVNEEISTPVESSESEPDIIEETPESTIDEPDILENSEADKDEEIILEIDDNAVDSDDAIGIDDDDESFTISENYVSDNASDESADTDDDENSEPNPEFNEFDEEFDDEYDYEAEELYEDIHQEKYCIGCGKCSEVCPMGIDVANVNGNIDFAECIHCQKCVASCPTGALQTKYFKAKVHPIVIFIISFILFFGVAVGFNFIKVDLDKDGIQEPLYDSIRVAPEKPSDGTFSIQEILDAYQIETFDELKERFCLDDSVTLESTYSEFTNGMRLEFYKKNDEDRYNDIVEFFGLDKSTAADLTLAQVYDNASIRTTSEYLGFDPQKADDFAAYFNASPDDKFGTISKTYWDMYNEYDKFINNDPNEWQTYISGYGYWYQDYYGAKYPEAKNYYDLYTDCAYEKDLTQFLATGKFTVQYMCDSSNTTLSELKETYHLTDNVTLRSPYSVFFNSVKLSYYESVYNSDVTDENTDGDSFEQMLTDLGLDISTYNPDMTIGEALDGLTMEQAAKYFGCETDEQIDNFITSYNATSREELFEDYHEEFNRQMDDYYDMMYQYYTQSDNQ